MSKRYTQIIDVCDECPACVVYNTHCELCRGKVIRRPMTEIPEWCPLEDVEE